MLIHHKTEYFDKTLEGHQVTGFIYIIENSVPTPSGAEAQCPSSK